MNNVQLMNLRSILKQFLDELEECDTSDMKAVKELDQKLKNIVSKIVLVLPNMSKLAKVQHILLCKVDECSVSYINKQIAYTKEFIENVISKINHILEPKLKCQP